MIWRTLRYLSVFSPLGMAYTQAWYWGAFLFPFFLFIPFIFFTVLLSFLPNRNSDAGSHRRLFSPLPSDGSGLVRALHYYREKTSTLAALVDSRRIYTGKCSSTRVEYMLGNVLVYLMLVWLDKIIVACNWQYIMISPWSDDTGASRIWQCTVLWKYTGFWQYTYFWQYWFVAAYWFVAVHWFLTVYWFCGSIVSYYYD